MDCNTENTCDIIERKINVIMKSLKYYFSVLALMMMSFVLNAQDGAVKTTDTMRSNGRIYVVIAVILTILIGLILYIVRLDRKISKLEREKEVDKLIS